MKTRANIQIGKNGLNGGIINCVRNGFKNHEIMKISLLKSAGHTRENVKNIADKIVSSLGKNYKYRIVGFSIFIKKQKR